MINPRTAAQIKACRGVYSIGDTARHFKVSKDTVWRIWHEKAHTAVLPASETPYVNRTRIPTAVITEDAEWLLRSGESVEQVAKRLGVSQRKIKEVAPALVVY